MTEYGVLEEVLPPNGRQWIVVKDPGNFQQDNKTYRLAACPSREAAEAALRLLRS
jgi:hypothetical protein